MKQEPLVSVILPVYNRLKYLEQAINSVLNQTYDNWELIIADDASEQETNSFLKGYSQIPKIKIDYNSQNIGLFPNLNQAIRRSNGDYMILLCSDDFFLPHCIEDSVSLLRQNPEAGLLLSPVNIVDSDGNELYSRSKFEYEQFVTKPVQLLQTFESLPLLLKFGSINASITRMFFTRHLYERVGGFKESWQHAADWEWLYRVANQNPILISKIPLATIRSHPEQLSGVNFDNCSNSLEVIEMVKILLKDPYVSQLDSAKTWALKIMQFHLWYAFKFAQQGHWKNALSIIQAVSKVTGFSSTFWAMLQWLPERWRVFRQKYTLLPKKYIRFNLK